MPPKNCGSCQKLVYPMDELKCLDKTWHKACFRCQVCSMTLNMKNYKGYSKLPYCNAHYPTTKFTAVADTPENMRIKKNTNLQSNIKYHAEFEAAKGQYTSVADDPETMRVKKNTHAISNVAYHGDMIRKQEMENARPTEIDATSSSVSVARVEPAPRRASGSISNYSPASENRSSPYSSRTQATTVFSSASNGQRQDVMDESGDPALSYSRTRRIGSITDYDPINDQFGSIVGQYTAPGVGNTQSSEPPVNGQPAPVFTRPAAPPVAAPRQTSPVRAPSPPPVREPTPPPVREPSPPPVREPSPVRQPSPPPVQFTQPSQPPAVSGDLYAGKGCVCKALYEYAAGDDDEVGFNEDDILINCEAIDEGWMNGTLERTGQSGMLPSNYVEKLNW